ncbi:MAG: C4-dicarboxylate transporter DcuC [Ignavibacteriae bacterium]|nr:C4-dicarboxylate transporter DcuC [Ignavibacteriota bacterium]
MNIYILLLSLSVLGAAVYSVVRGVDVRLVLFAAGLILASLALKPLIVFDTFQRVMGDGKIIGPICSAMGYAFVLRATCCDREMVRLLMRPIRQIRWLLIPGGCFVGFFTNMAITSQTAAAAAVGPILVPILLAARIHPIIAGAVLVLGCSGGGNLFNPGEPDIVAIQTATLAPLPSVLDAAFQPELIGFGVAVVVFTMMAFFMKPTAVTEEVELPDENSTAKIQYYKALLPPLPVAVLLLCQPKFHLFPSLLALYPDGLPVVHVMLFFTIIVLLLNYRDISSLTKTFFEGLGYAYIHVISLIIAASCLIAGMEAVGLVQIVVSMVSNFDFTAKTISGSMTWLLAVLSGSGTAPSVSFSKAVLPTLAKINQQGAVDLGVIGAIGATFGRTMSPVAAVVIFTTTLVKTTPFELIKRTAPALIAGFIVLLIITAL